MKFGLKLAQFEYIDGSPIWATLASTFNIGPNLYSLEYNAKILKLFTWPFCIKTKFY